MKAPRACSALFAALILAACTSTPESTPERDAWAKEFEPVTRDSVIYVYRPDMLGTMAVTDLYVDKRLIGSSLPGTFNRIAVLPGHHLLEVFAAHGAPIEVVTHGNDVVFVELQNYSSVDGTPNMRFRVVPPEHGKAAILACCSRLENFRHDQPRLMW
jgi:hypothetical protein